MLLMIMALSAVMLPRIAHAQGPTATVSPTTGASGTKVTVSGGGYSADADLQIGIDQTPMTSIVADSGGKFTGSFNIPSNTARGAHTIYATDGTKKATASFTVT